MALVAAVACVELLRFPVEAQRARYALEAMTSSASRAGVRLVPTKAYRGGSPWLLIWGPGAPDRFEPMRRQLAAGGRVIALDLSYWQRERKFRVSIDAAHPQAWIMRREWPVTRLLRDKVQIETAWDPTGPVIVAGIGEKATVQYGAKVREWELAMIAEAQGAGFTVRYRPKKTASIPPGVQPAAAGSIESALRGASRVITWHSNVAVDAIRLGIPVVCRDGAAAAVSPSAWTAEFAPLTPETRDRFLGNLAWYQWDPSEAAACWAWLREALA